MVLLCSAGLHRVLVEYLGTEYCTVLLSAVFVVLQSFLTLALNSFLKSIREASKGQEMQILSTVNQLVWWVERSNGGGVDHQISEIGFGRTRPWTSLKMFF